MKVKRMIKSDVDTFKVGDIIKVKLTDGVKVQAMAMQQEEDGMIFCLVDCLPACCLPCGRPAAPAAGFHHAFKPWAGTDRPPPVVQAWTLCAPLRAFLPVMV